MELLDRYVNAVKSFLPKQQQDDIGKELTANIQAQMDDREGELGRPLSENEQVVILHQHGHPMVVAAPYQPNQGSLVFGRQLIGTTLFPFYLRVLGVTMGITFLVYAIVLTTLAITGNPITFEGTLNAILLEIFIQFTVITAIFAGVEQYAPAPAWDVHRPPTMQPLFRQGQQPPRLEAVAEIAGIIVFLIWLRFVLVTPTLIFGTVANTYQLGPIWHNIALPFLLYCAVFIAQALAILVRPSLARIRPVVRIITDIAALGLSIYLLRADHWVVLIHPIDADSVTLTTINHSVYYGLLSLVIGVAIVLVVDVWKLLRGQPKPAA